MAADNSPPVGDNPNRSNSSEYFAPSSAGSGRFGWSIADAASGSGKRQIAVGPDSLSKSIDGSAECWLYS
jgi:hypothetical protein